MIRATLQTTEAALEAEVNPRITRSPSRLPKTVHLPPPFLTPHAVSYLSNLKGVPVSSPVRTALLALVIAAAAYCALSSTGTAFNYQSIFQMPFSLNPNLTITASLVIHPQNPISSPPSPSNLYPPVVCPADEHAAKNVECLTSPNPITPSPNNMANNSPPAPTCPDYFRYIHDDLRPWTETGVTRQALEAAKTSADLHLAVINGRLYVIQFRWCWYNRIEFTVWGLLQILRRYHGRIPDMELMFSCSDVPTIKAKEYENMTAWPPPSLIPPLFRYSGDDETLDIVIPDWSFWGWPDLNLKPWEQLSEELKEANKLMRWTDREPYAFWRGTAYTTKTRADLLDCNPSEEKDWNVRLFIEDWNAEAKKGYNESDLARQCNYRYKIYVEGISWSVSLKNILACDSPTFLIGPKYYDFFSRGLVPFQHYWPINSTDICSSIKFAVDWGNSNDEKIQVIGKQGSRFVQEELRMDYVYDYMFHLFTKYAKLLQFKPEVPTDAFVLCPEYVACPMTGRDREYIMQSLVNAPTDVAPCSMPLPFSTEEREAIKRRKDDALNLVESWRLKGTMKDSDWGTIGED